jgi:transcription elongation factor Elf1
MISEIIYQLPLIDIQRKGNKYHFKCFICGDSASNKTKKRGWIFQYKGNWFYKCFNCGESYHFYSFLKIYFPDLYIQFIKKSIKGNVKSNEKEIEKSIQEELKLYNQFPLISIAELDKNHFAYQYIHNRKIPIKTHKNLFYSGDFVKFVNKILNDRYKDWKWTDKRIVIPFKKKNGDIFAFQGRSLENNSQLRYLTFKIDEEYPKIFGLDRIKYDEKIIICEGPFDSLFINNCCAAAGSDLSEENINRFFNKDQCVLLFDLEPRNYEINSKIERFLKFGYNICLLPKYFKKYGKDINDIVINSSLTVEEINNMIHQNIVYGKEGILKHKQWRIK